MTRSSLPWSAGDSSATSSRKRVPPCAERKSPRVSATAPEKAPRTWPKNSDSMRSAGIALQLTGTRSEEHTSELQSRLHLVCRLLLEKKKKNDSKEQQQCMRVSSSNRPDVC